MPNTQIFFQSLKLGEVGVIEVAESEVKKKFKVWS